MVDVVNRASSHTDEWPARSSAPNGSLPSAAEAHATEDLVDNSTSDGAATGISYSAIAPGGAQDLSWIALQSFSLGGILFVSVLAVVYCFYLTSTAWRTPAFFVCLSVFHFLEFYTTARWNTRVAKADSFLLFNNTSSYTIAHTLATLETLASMLFPSYQRLFVGRWTIALGLLLVVVGQVTRSLAMIQAGQSFNHKIQHQRRDDHRLITTGVYQYFRHPSYFGFFYWALGTQLLVGNKVCFLGYAAVLWRFFSRRIETEEKYLVTFFKDYEAYRKRTGTMIPFVP